MQFPHLREPDTGELLLPAVQRLLGDAEPATDFGHFLSALDLAKRSVDDLSLLRPLRSIVDVSWPVPPACFGNHKSLVFTFPV